MLQDSVHAYYLAASFIVSIANHLVVGVVSGSDVSQRTVFVGLLNLQFQDIETVIDLKLMTHVIHVEGIELGLCLLQRNLHVAHLHNLSGMIWTDAQRQTTVNNIFSESKGKRGNAFLRCLVANGIIVERAQHAADVRIEVGTILLAHHLLQDYSHLFLVDNVGCGCHIRLGVAVIHRSVNALYGGGEHLQHLVLVLKIRYHVGAVDTGERLIVTVLEKT